MEALITLTIIILLIITVALLMRFLKKLKRSIPGEPTEIDYIENLNKYIYLINKSETYEEFKEALVTVTNNPNYTRNFQGLMMLLGHKAKELDIDIYVYEKYHIVSKKANN